MLTELLFIPHGSKCVSGSAGRYIRMMLPSIQTAATLSSGSAALRMERGSVAAMTTGHLRVRTGMHMGAVTSRRQKPRGAASLEGRSVSPDGQL